MLGVAAVHQTWLAALLFVFRTAFARANVPCVQSIIFESVLVKHRGRWADANPHICEVFRFVDTCD